MSVTRYTMDDTDHRNQGVFMTEDAEGEYVLYTDYLAKPTPTPNPGSEWRPIETAPKDGTIILVTGWNYGKPGTERHYAIASYAGGVWAEGSDWVEDSEWNKPGVLKYLTHWMPLPQPPNREGE